MSKKILLIEDEPMIAMLLEDFIDMAGHEAVGPSETLDAALAAVESGGFDAAIMDINLNGQKAWAVADALRTRAIPFAISSGAADSEIPKTYADAPLLKKPYMLMDVQSVIDQLLGG